MKTFSFKTRQLNIEKLQSEFYDLVIIGGGINGAGIARDASLRGLKVALVEGADFASGTSSRSSKLIHGGIRYLENLEFGLVFEALSERSKLFEIIPHLVHPLKFMIPLFKDSRVSMTKMGLGMWLYDLLALFQTPEIHERLNPQQTLERMSILNPQQLVGSYTYFDAYMDDDLIVHETLRSANDHGAVCVNYVQAVGANFNQKNKISSIQVRDQLSQKEFSIQGQYFVSTVGPWTDQLGSKILKNWKNKLRPTKGVHLTFKKDRLPLSSAVVMGAEKSDRIVFGIPRHEMIIIGTTDTDFTGDPSQVKATSEDVDYLLKIANNYFPGAQLTRSDILTTYAGVRPLVKDESSTEGKTSREHEIIDFPEGISFVAGGKYTTYRLIAEQAVDQVLKFFPIEDRARFGTSKSNSPLNEWTGADSFLKAKQKISHYQKISLLKAEELQKLVDRFGLEVEEIFKKFPETMTYWQIQAAQAIETTMCLNLVDFYSRRTHLFLAEKNHGLDFLDEIIVIFQVYFGWSESETNSQKKLLKDYIESESTWKN